MISKIQTEDIMMNLQIATIIAGFQIKSKLKINIKRYYDIHKWEAKTKNKLLLKQKRFRNAKDGTNGKTYHISPDDMEFVFDDEGKKE